MKQKPVVLFDRNCYLCQQSKKVIKFLDWLKVFDLYSLQEYEKTQPTLSSRAKEMLRGEIHVIKPNGETVAGYQAVRYILARIILTSPLGWLMYLPKSEIIGDPVYRWIAKNRYKLFQDKCTDGSCKLPA
ncbi:thiol-disulfide oxidoreductase DCC family protein [Sediminibacillus massiliensis]|uniref:thiol-disulfide oxidoreductase DCC family protein n=1 Tax=Sediminibacillus massiliensis TaxID=1926277 RepID=UPI0009887F38|nr:DUF393 domain-containing protein [Sediminibacillus massiliensis]